MTQTHEIFKKDALKELSSQFESWGFTDIRSPHLLDRYPSTRTVGGFQPDMTFKKHNVQFIVEVETREILDKEETWEEWLVYSDRVKEIKGCFWILVPQGQSFDFIRKINEMRVEASVHEV
ncbi:MAG: hypothetical protein HQL84_15680 [Magnetococcales bacterium]|nr:hypothetical protein [Magnetococcales bacterium]MBF0151461.1 hypothetical protein [Magnetococcales bacterium]MBF0174487.1 hypothetical protein [Magnetococcales bacterium]MBF0346969.1 hypothetical protein [Magnetococcales bacterium]MBF0632480.1 hypothetical protein [Magnetococcales bacterium]